MSRRGWLLFIAMCVIWGIPYLLIKVAIGELAPSTLVLARTALATLLLLPIALARGQVRPLLPRWLPLLAFALVEICAPWLLLGFAEQHISSSLTGLLVAAVPLVGAVLARFSGDHEPLGARRTVGLLAGIAGVAALVGFEVGATDVRAVLAVGVVAVCYAVGPVILSRSLSDLPGLAVIAVSLGVAALLYVPAGIAQAPDHWPSAKVVGSVLVLAVVCTAVAFLVFFQLIAEVGPARSTVITYVNPAVAVLLGVVVLDESFTAATAAGFVLILGGSVLATSRARAAAPRPAPSAAEVECADLAAPIAEP
ncbi:MAG TPA: DMT family transporter [Candidatus Eisenbacteria bacterium]|nr:DMT family transporter [Candidatus Eisenbacteria bacterium]